MICVYGKEVTDDCPVVKTLSMDRSNALEQLVAFCQLCPMRLERLQALTQ